MGLLLALARSGPCCGCCGGLCVLVGVGRLPVPCCWLQAGLAGWLPQTLLALFIQLCLGCFFAPFY